MSIESLLNQLDCSRDAFLDEVSEKISTYIRQEGKDCIAVVEEGTYGKYTYRLNKQDPIDFCKVLFKFIRRKQHNGHNLDSALTEPISELVEKFYTSYFDDHLPEISNAFHTMMVTNEVVLNAFVGKVTDAVSSSASKQARKHIAHLLAHQIKEAASSNTGHAVGHHISHFAATTTGHQLAVVASQLLVKLLASHLQALIAHFLASAAAKKIIIMIVKKYVAAAVLYAVAQFLAVHLGIASTGVVLWAIIAPIMVVILIKEINGFPKKLGEEVAKNVRAELSDQFRGTNRNVLEKIWDDLLDGTALVKAIVNDKEFKETFEMLREKYD